MALILDTGVIVALLNANDDHHQACVQLVLNTHEPLVVPAAALFEVEYWLRTRSAFEAWEIFVEDIESGPTCWRRRPRKTWSASSSWSASTRISTSTS